MILAACRDIRPGRKAADDLLSVPTSWVGHPVLCSLCGESRQTREEARPFSVAALSSGPVPLSSGSHQVAQSLRRSSASDRESRYAVLSLAPSGTTPNSRKRHSSINNFGARATIPTYGLVSHRGRSAPDTIGSGGCAADTATSTRPSRWRPPGYADFPP